MRTGFVPAFDVWIDKWAEDWGAKNKVEVQVDHIFPADFPAKIAAEVAAGGGHDLYNFSQTGAVPLYAKQLVDVSDIAKQVGQQYGGWVLPLSERYGVVEGVWRGVPDNFIDFPTLYRKDLFDAAGLKPVDTWDDLLKAGTVLKEKGNPIGICINQKANDGNNSWNTLLWCYGASYVAEDGKTVTINSPQTKEAVTYALELYNKTMTNVVLSWDDSGNNQYLASGVGSGSRIRSVRCVRLRGATRSSPRRSPSAPPWPAPRPAWPRVPGPPGVCLTFPRTSPRPGRF
jgi:multiple sugar transport system substrate-binding protein